MPHPRPSLFSLIIKERPIPVQNVPGDDPDVLMVDQQVTLTETIPTTSQSATGSFNNAGSRTDAMVIEMLRVVTEIPDDAEVRVFKKFSVNPFSGSSIVLRLVLVRLPPTRTYPVTKMVQGTKVVEQVFIRRLRPEQLGVLESRDVVYEGS